MAYDSSDDDDFVTKVAAKGVEGKPTKSSSVIQQTTVEDSDEDVHRSPFDSDVGSESDGGSTSSDDGRPIAKKATKPKPVAGSSKDEGGVSKGGKPKGGGVPLKKKAGEKEGASSHKESPSSKSLNPKVSSGKVGMVG